MIRNCTTQGQEPSRGFFKPGSTGFKPRHIFMLLLSLIFLVSIFLFVRKLISYRTEDLKYRAIAAQIPQQDPASRFVEAEPMPVVDHPPETVFEEPPDSPGKMKPQPPPYQILSGNPRDLDEHGMLKDYSALRKQNEDLAGWIRVPGFKKEIQYPVMYSGDDAYYLSRDFYKNESYAGSIFMDSRNDPVDADQHLILYGHAMNDMSMFGNFKNYPGDPDACEKVDRIYLDLMHCRLEYEIFSAYYAGSDENYRQIDFYSENEFLTFLKGLQERSLYPFGGPTLTGKDKILTLSTCNSEQLKNGRAVVHARLTRMILYGAEGQGEQVPPSAISQPREPGSANVYLSELKITYDDPSAWVGVTQTPDYPAPSADFDAYGMPSPQPPPPLSPQTEVVLDPPFSTVEKEYKATIPASVEQVTVQVVPSDPKAILLIAFNGEKRTNASDLSIPFGENRIEITVTSRDGQFSRKYTIRLIRESIPGDEAVPSETPEATAVETSESEKTNSE